MVSKLFYPRLYFFVMLQMKRLVCRVVQGNSVLEDLSTSKFDVIENQKENQSVVILHDRIEPRLPDR